MIAAKVIGTIVSTQKEKSMEGLKFMLLQQVDMEGRETGGQVVAVDAVGAGIGEYVLYASGSSARQTVATDKKPVDAVIMAIIDSWDVNGVIKYRKYETDSIEGE